MSSPIVPNPVNQPITQLSQEAEAALVANSGAVGNLMGALSSLGTTQYDPTQDVTNVASQSNASTAVAASDDSGGDDDTPVSVRKRRRDLERNLPINPVSPNSPDKIGK